MTNFIGRNPRIVKSDSDPPGEQPDHPFKVYFLQERSEKQREQSEEFRRELEVITLGLTWYESGVRCDS